MTQTKSLKNLYGLAVVLSCLIVLGVGFGAGWGAILPVLILSVIEITFSFDNAVINSAILAHLSLFWQKMFLTVGIAIAVFGVRLLLPVLLVAMTAHHSMGHVLDLALHHPDIYAEELHQAYPLIAAFGGVFLLLIGLRFFGEKREVRWLGGIEAPLAEFNQPWSVVFAGGAVAVLVTFWLAPTNHDVTIAALLGGLTFLVIKGVGELLVGSGHGVQKNMTGSAALTQFLYLELLDASFSFDGVIAAFAITKNVLLIACGLGIGALYVRSMTLHLIHRGTLMRYRYLIHGAHYAIASLGVLLLLGIRYDIPELITGILGLLFIGAAVMSSIYYNRQLIRQKIEKVL